MSKRERCIKELVDTEKNYINALQMIREVELYHFTVTVFVTVHLLW